MYKTLVLHQSAIVRNELSKCIGEHDAFEMQMAVQDVKQAYDCIDRRLPSLVIIQIDNDPKQVLKFISQILQSHSNIIAVYDKSPDSEKYLQHVVGLGVRNFIALPTQNLKEYFVKQSDQLSHKLTDAADFIEQREQKASGSEKKGLIVLGASMGGTTATEKLLQKLPQSIAGMVIVQHMGKNMISNYAERLDRAGPLLVKLAEDGEMIQAGKVLVAPDDCHTLIRRKGNHYVIELQAGERIGHHLPAVDQLFRSAADSAGKDALGIILTGMGEDGALAISMMRKQGAMTIAQDEESSQIFGMPKAAIIYGGIEKVLALDDIPGALLKYASSH